MSTSHEFFPANDDAPRNQRPLDEQASEHLQPTFGSQQGRDAANQTPHSILQSQRRFGNRYVQRLLGVSQFRPQPALGIQRKLYVKEVVELADGLPKDIASRIEEALKEVTTEPKIESQEIQSIITEWIKEPKLGRAYSTWTKVILDAISEAERRRAKQQTSPSKTGEIPAPPSMESKQEDVSAAPPPPPLPSLATEEESLSKPKGEYDKCLVKGKERAKALKSDDPKQKPKGVADDQKRRDELFKLYSITDSEVYQGSKQATLAGDLGGTYVNKSEKGHIGAENNVHTTPGKSLLSNSEILYQMYRDQMTGGNTSTKVPQLEKLSRINVASGTGSPVVIYIQHLEKQKGNLVEITVDDSHPYFYALLGTDNGTAAEWLIRDHGKELNIGGIKGARLIFKGATIEFFFTPFK